MASGTLPPPIPSPTPRAASIRRSTRRTLSHVNVAARRRRRRRAPRLTWQSASFGFGLATTWIVIAFLWSIAPFSLSYLVYTVLTSTVPAWRPYRPAPNHVALKCVHYVFVAYCALELPFAVAYRTLAAREQRLRKPLRHPRRHLRKLILTSLENGLYEETSRDEDKDDDEANRSAGPHARVSQDDKFKQTWLERAAVDDPARPGRGRQRVNQSRGDGAATPDGLGSNEDASDYLSAARHQLPTLLRTDAPRSHLEPSTSRTSAKTCDEEQDEIELDSIRHSLDSAFVSNSSSPPRRLRSLSDASGTGRRLRFEQDERHKEKQKRQKSSAIPELSASDPRAVDFREYLRYWFNGCQFGEIKRLNMADWLAWSLYGQTFESIELERKQWDREGRPRMKLDDGTHDDLDDADEDEAEEEIEGDKYGLVMHCVDLIEARAGGHRFERGRNETIKTLRLTLDPVRVTQRPLILYLVVALLQNGVLGATKLKGFKQIRDGKVKYLYRMPKDWSPDPNGPESTKPLVFIHGLGMGSAQYATFMSYLCSHRSFRDRPILVLLQPHISMSFFERAYHDPPDRETLVASLARTMKRFKFDQANGATVLSHSNGTIVHGWLTKACPDLCARNCFVDPVCFCLWEPFVCYNFLYSKPKTPIEYLMRYFVSRELGIAVMLSRTFEWTSNLLLPREIPNLSDPTKSAVFLASEDSILNAPRVKTYLARNGFVETFERNVTLDNGARGGARLKVFDGLKHGQSMIGEGEAFEEIMEWICRAPRGTLAPGTASPVSSAPASLANSPAVSGTEDVATTTTTTTTDTN